MAGTTVTDDEAKPRLYNFENVPEYYADGLAGTMASHAVAKLIFATEMFVPDGGNAKRATHVLVLSHAALQRLHGHLGEMVEDLKKMAGGAEKPEQAK